MTAVASVLDNLWQVGLDAAPWLLLGLLASGLMKAFVPTHLLTRWLGGRGLAPVVKAAVIGTPLPLCSCGVLPAAIGLHRQGASRGATVSFLIATPENGVDSIALSYALLGPFMTIVRPIAAGLSAILAGVLAELAPARAPQHTLASATCCNGAAGGAGESCCASAPAPASCGCDDTAEKGAGGNAAPARPGVWSRLRGGVRFALVDILDDVAPWLAVGLVLAAAVASFIPPDSLHRWGSGLPAKLMLLAVGVPMYICATASTPVAAAMLLVGVSPGTVLVFLLAGPATNLGSVLALRREMGLPTVAAYLAGICIGALACGVATDLIAQHWHIAVQAQHGAGGEIVPRALAIASAGLLLLLALRPLRRAVFGV